MARTIRAALAIGAGLILLTGGAGTAYADGDDSATAAQRAAEAAARAAADAARAAADAARAADERANAPQTVVTLQVAASGKCLEINNGAKDNGVKAQQYTCNGTTAQQWRMVPAADSTYELRSVPSGKCLEVENSGTKAGDAAQQWTCHGGANTRWQAILVDHDKKLFQLRPQHVQDRCLDIPGANKENNVKAQQWYCNQSDAQLWKITPVK
ncbi:RICIN domain-containing protein [Streptomyces sp. NPDC037389]|uniref:RICIN domain-containing protein n=1 Tax=Streptomyces sp. NPDC037389 TaxID=3155369 RepID=UPI00340C021A